MGEGEKMTTRIKGANHKFLRRPCEKCRETFRPSSKFSYVCDACKDKIEWGKWFKKGIKMSINNN